MDESRSSFSQPGLEEELDSNAQTWVSRRAKQIEAKPEPVQERDEGGTFDDIITGIIDGTAQAIQEGPQRVVDVLDAISPDLVSQDWINGGLSQAIEDNMVDFLERAPIVKSLNAIGELGADGSISRRIKEGPDGMAGAFAKEITRTGIGMIGVGKVLNLSKGFNALATQHKYVAAAITSGIGDFVTVDPYEERAADLLKEFEMTEELGNMLGTDTSDSAFEAALKASLEGAVIGEGLMLAGKAFAKTGAANTIKNFLTSVRYKNKFVENQWLDKAGERLPDKQWDAIVRAATLVQTTRQSLDSWLTAKEIYSAYQGEDQVLTQVKEFIKGGRKGELDDQGKEVLEALEYKLAEPSGAEVSAEKAAGALDKRVVSYIDEMNSMTPQAQAAKLGEDVGLKMEGILGEGGNLDELISDALQKSEIVEKKYFNLVTSDVFQSLSGKQQAHMLKFMDAPIRKTGPAAELHKANQQKVVEALQKKARDIKVKEVGDTPQRILDQMAEHVRSLNAEVTPGRAAATAADFSSVKLGDTQFEVPLSRLKEFEQYASQPGVSVGEALAKAASKMFSGPTAMANFSAVFDAGSPQEALLALESLGDFFLKNSRLKIPQTVESWEKQAKGILREMGAEETFENMKRLNPSDIPEGPVTENTLTLHQKLASQAIASRAILNAAVENFQSLKIGSAAQSNLKARVELANAARWVQEAYRMDQGLGSDLGRGLRARQVDPTMDALKTMRQMNSVYGDSDKLIKQLNQALNAKDIANVMDGNDGWYNHWVGGLLSNPVTWVVNGTSGALNIGFKPVERALAAAYRGDVADMTDSLKMLMAIPGSFRGALRAGRLAAKTGVSSFGGTEFQKGVSRRASGVGRLANNRLQSTTKQDGGYRILKALEYALDIPGKVLVSTDEMLKMMNFSMELQYQARKIVREVAPELSGAEYTARVSKVAEELVDPQRITDPKLMEYKFMAEEANTKAQDYAAAQTWTTDIAGTSAFADLLKYTQKNAAGRWVLPFAQTPMNLMRDTLAHLPALDLLVKAERAKYGRLLKGDGSVVPEKAAQLTMGMGAFATVMEGVEEGYITGAGPLEPGQRAVWLTHYQPNSIRIGDTWYRYDRLLPWGGWIGLMADYGEMSNDMDYQTNSSVSSSMMEALMNRMSDMSFTKGIFEFLNAIDDPDNMGRYLASQAGTLVPLSAGMRAARNQIDPTLRDVRAVDSTGERNYWLQALNEIKNGVPGWSKSLPPRTNIFGEPLEKLSAYGFDAVNPFQASAVDTDPRSKLLASLSISFDPRSMQRTGQGNMLTAEQTYQWIQEMNRGGRLKERLYKLMDSPSFMALPDEAKQKTIQKILSKEKRRALQRLYRDPEWATLKTRDQITSLESRGGGTASAKRRIATLRASLET